MQSRGPPVGEIELTSNFPPSKADPEVIGLPNCVRLSDSAALPKNERGRHGRAFVDEENSAMIEKHARDGDTAKPVADAADLTPMLFGVPLKWVSLIALTLQTSGQALLIRWSKAQTVEGERRYLSSAAVLFIEVLKLSMSVGLVVFESGDVGLAFRNIQMHFTQNPFDLAKAAVPSLIYTVQNNLMFYSLEKLSAPVQQVLYQSKVITTAGIGVLMLGKSLTTTQWVACFSLAVGVGLVQFPRGDVNFSPESFGGDHVKGFIAVLGACCTSGFAGVWIQKMLQQTQASIWVRNVQLATFGAMSSLVVAIVQDGETIIQDGLTQGFNGRVVSVIVMTAVGGLLCAVMLKYAGATHGCFSTAMSIILTSLLSQFLFADFSLDLLFALGSFVAIGASVVFAVGVPTCFSTVTAPLAMSPVRKL